MCQHEVYNHLIYYNMRRNYNSKCWLNRLKKLGFIKCEILISQCSYCSIKRVSSVFPNTCAHDLGTTESQVEID